MAALVPASPAASTPGVRRRMQVLSRKRDTGPELALRRELHRRGLRYRVDIPPLSELPRRRADVVFTRAKVAVFIDGWWQVKLDRVVARDAETTAALAAAGWQSLRVWEHADPASAAAMIAVKVAARGGRRWRT
jgi:DNA mismatch endonuclease, patch repair protein